MSNNEDSGKMIAMLVVLILLITAPYVLNAYKFIGCDFESDYKCEAIHGIGVIAPPASYITVWFEDDRKD